MTSTDTAHVCVDGQWVEDVDVPTETNEHHDRWCARCGERVLTEKETTR